MTDTSPATLSVNLEGQVALITGAAGVIGSGVARKLAAGGATVCLAGREGAAECASEITSAGGKALSVSADMRRKADIEAMVAQCLDAFGRIDILVTVAGVTSPGRFGDIAEEEWDRVLSINLKGVFLSNQAVIETMKAQGYGRIVNIGSVLGKNGGNPRPWIDPAEQAGASNAAYGAAKAGVHALTLYLAKELASHGVTVNAVAPGPIASPMTTKLPASLTQQIPVGRMGTAEEVAAAVAYLCARESGFVTGEILDVNGGLWVD